MDKSFVSLEGAYCPACGKLHETGAILLDKRRKDSMERITPTHFELCKDCNKEGYVLLIEVDPSKSTVSTNGNIAASDAYRTGKVAYIKEHLFKEMFKIPENKEVKNMCYVEQDVMRYLESLKEESNETN